MLAEINTGGIRARNFDSGWKQARILAKSRSGNAVRKRTRRQVWQPEGKARLANHGQAPSNGLLLLIRTSREWALTKVCIPIATRYIAPVARAPHRPHTGTRPPSEAHAACAQRVRTLTQRYFPHGFFRRTPSPAAKTSVLRSQAGPVTREARSQNKASTALLPTVLPYGASQFWPGCGTTWDEKQDRNARPGIGVTAARWRLL